MFSLNMEFKNALQSVKLKSKKIKINNSKVSLLERNNEQTKMCLQRFVFKQLVWWCHRLKRERYISYHNKNAKTLQSLAT